MDMQVVRHQVAAQEWQKRILEQRSSGQNVKRGCLDNNIRENRYYYWLNVLRNEEMAVSKPSGMFAELQRTEGKTEINQPTSGICAVIRGQGLCLEIHNGADQATLEKTMRTLGGSAARVILPDGARIYVACGYTDMRKQIDGLAQMVEQNFHLDPFSNAFFLFCGRRRLQRG